MKLTPLVRLFLLFAGLVAAASAQDRHGPFTHAPRSVRSRDVDQQHIRLELTFDWDRRQMQGRAVHTLRTYKPLRSVTLDAAHMQIQKVEQLDGSSSSGGGTRPTPLKFATEAEKLTIQLGRQYDAGQIIRLAIDYVVTEPERGVHFVTADPGEPGQANMVWTQSEPQYARCWVPCIDSPADRLTSEIIATVPEPYLVLSNGTLKRKVNNGDGTKTWHWVQAQTHVPYLLSVVAGRFDAFRQQWDGIPIVSYVPEGRLADAARSFEKTPEMVRFFSQKIGRRYPWPKYAQICVDEYGGGMEHTSATTLTARTLHDARAQLDTSSDGLVAHELAHQWFGDLLTCKDWAELWLNESFATYLATVWTEQDKGWDEATWQRHQEAGSYLAEDKRYRRPIVTYRYNRPSNMFDRHSYPKGGRVLHMLRFELGDDRFWKAIKHYTTVNQFRVVETADLRTAIEEATGQGMNWFFDQWLYHGGHPEFDVAWRWDDQAKLVRLTVKQTQKVDQMTPLFRTSAEIEIAARAESVIRRVTLSKTEERFHFERKQRPTRVCFDPQDWILKTLHFPKSKQELLDQLAEDPHVMCRARAAEGLAGYAKDADVRIALCAAAQHDPFWGVRQEAAKALSRFKGPAVRSTLIQIAKRDEKSLVRREAIKSLSRFAHDKTRQALREIIGHDRSYYAIAEALRTLSKVDRKRCAADLLAALRLGSHRDVILKAACDGLVKLKEPRAEPRLRAMLNQSITPPRRVILIGALARLRPDDQQAAELLRKQLDNDRRHVREAAIDALAALGGAASIEALQARREKEDRPAMLRKIDDAIDQIRQSQRESEQLRKQIESLKKQNRELENRIQALERAAK